MPRFLIVDDHPLFSAALQSALRRLLGDADIYEATSIEGALDVLAAHDDFDLAFLDLVLPDSRGFDGLIRIRASFPKLPVVVVSSHDNPHLVLAAISLGIAGYIPKSTSRAELSLAINEVMDGSIYTPKSMSQALREARACAPEQNILKRLRDLTPQQLAVLMLIREGLQNKQIAYQLKLAETTVKAHVSEILRKLNVASRTNAVIEIAKVDFVELLARAAAAAPSHAIEAGAPPAC